MPGHHVGIGAAREKYVEPKTEIGDSVENNEGADDKAEEEVNSVAAGNRGSALKHELSALAPEKRRAQDAYISIHRRTHQQSGGKTVVKDEPVTIKDEESDEERELREYRFIITQSTYKNAERFTVRSTFGDGPEVAHSFGEQPRMWQFQGLLRRGNKAQETYEYTNNWWQALNEMYRKRLRASLLMKNNEFIRLRVGKLSIRGYITSFLTSQNERGDDASAQFRFSMYVRSYRFTNDYEYTPASEKLAADNPILTEGLAENSDTDAAEATDTTTLETGDVADVLGGADNII